MSDVSQSTRQITMAVIALVGVVAVVLLLRGGDGGAVVHAQFRSANNLAAGDEVRVHGVKVGEVRRIDLHATQSTADVTMHLDGEDVPLMRDATASLRWRTVFGGSLYVDLDPGDPAVGASSSRSIPLKHTTTQVEVDEVLQPLDGATGGRIQQTLKQLRRGLSAPHALRSTIVSVSPAMNAVGRGLPPLLGQQNGDLRALVKSTGQVTSALARDPSRLQALVTGAAGTLRVTATRRGEIGQALQRSPATMAQVIATAKRIDATLPILDPLASRLRPGARELASALQVTRPTLDRASTVLTKAKPLLRDLQPAFASLAATSRVGTPLLDELQPTLNRLAQDILPWLARHDGDTGRRTYEMIGPTVAAASGAAAQFDGGGYWLRFPPMPGERGLLSAPCQTFLTDPTAAQKVRCDELETALQKILGGRR